MMHTTLKLLAALILGTLPGLVAADLLAEIKSRGTLVVGVKDATPPFGFISAGSRTIVGYDVDIAEAIAKRLGVQLRTVPVTTATRIPELAQGKIDLIVATMTHTKDRARQIDFSHTYFVTRQKVLVRKDAGITEIDQLAGKRVSSVRGSTSEQNIRRAVPGVRVVSFNDYPNAFLALAQNKVAAMTTDEIILMDLHRRAPNPGNFELLDQYISTEPYGIGVRKGEAALLNEVNRILMELEKSGEAARIYDKWFGPNTDTPLKRDFKIGPARL
jgi:polar amino acid transport system substrate-binding protein